MVCLLTFLREIRSQWDVFPHWVDNDLHSTKVLATQNADYGVAMSATVHAVATDKSEVFRSYINTANLFYLERYTKCAAAHLVYCGK